MLLKQKISQNLLYKIRLLLIGTVFSYATLVSATELTTEKPMANVMNCIQKTAAETLINSSQTLEACNIDMNSSTNTNKEKLNVSNRVNRVIKKESDDKVNSIALNTISPDTLKIFVQTLEVVRKNYLEPVNDDALLVGAVQGMLSSLDPHAEFLNASSYENLQNFTQGELAELGITLTYSDVVNGWQIQAIHQDSSAFGKLKVGDIVHSIDKVKLTSQIREKDIEQKLDGLAGSVVRIRVSNLKKGEYTLRLQRNVVKDASVMTQVDKSVAIITIPVFQDNTEQQIIEALVNLKQPIIGLVIDIRNNPGGVLTSAMDVAGLFASNMHMVNIETRDGGKIPLRTESISYLKGVPTVILQNHHSASAAELLASGLQFNNVVKVVGETSYGKGTIQSVVPMDDGSAVKLTVAKYSKPNGQVIHGVGVMPDVIFPYLASMTARSAGSDVLNEEDVWLSLAVSEIINQAFVTNKNSQQAASNFTHSQNIENSEVKKVTISSQDTEKSIKESSKKTKAWLFSYPN